VSVPRRRLLDVMHWPLAVSVIPSLLGKRYDWQLGLRSLGLVRDLLPGGLSRL
jgi:hypothetical protein